MFARESIRAIYTVCVCVYIARAQKNEDIVVFDFFFDCSFGQCWWFLIFASFFLRRQKKKKTKGTTTTTTTPFILSSITLSDEYCSNNNKE